MFKVRLPDEYVPPVMNGNSTDGADTPVEVPDNAHSFLPKPVTASTVSDVVELSFSVTVNTLLLSVTVLT